MLKLMTFNILRDGSGEAGDRRERIAAVVRRQDPDILCMQEGGDDPCWQVLAADSGFKHAQNIPGEFQPALFSKRPVRAAASHSGVKFVYFQVALGAATLGVYSVHLVHWPQYEAERAAALRKLLSFVQAQGDSLVCIAGDFNSRTRGEPGLDWGVERIARHNRCIIGPQDWVLATDLMADAGFVDCYRRLKTEPGYTLHPLTNGSSEPGDPIPPQWLKRIGGDLLMPPVARIDYIFANPPLAQRLVNCEIDDSDETFQASDHLPLAATFEL